jgi:hypothetical protein
MTAAEHACHPSVQVRGRISRPRHKPFAFKRNLQHIVQAILRVLRDFAAFGRFTRDRVLIDQTDNSTFL